MNNIEKTKIINGEERPLLYKEDEEICKHLEYKSRSESDSSMSYSSLDSSANEDGTCIYASSSSSSSSPSQQQQRSNNGLKLRIENMAEIPPWYIYDDDWNFPNRRRRISMEFHRIMELLDMKNSSGSDQMIFGLVIILCLGTLLGFMLPPNPELNGQLYPYVSASMGYTYFFCWSLFYYPQAFQNYQRKDTEGLSPDFCALQWFGCGCYALQTFCFYTLPNIQQLYKERHDGICNVVELNDVAFGLHSLIMCSVWIFQFFYYTGSFIPSKPTVMLLIIAGMVITIYGAGLLLVAQSYTQVVPSWLISRLNGLDFLYMVTNFSVLAILLSFLPQVLLNYKLKSTEGFTIWSVLLDFMGGLLSVLQLICDSYNQNDASGIQGDFAKLFIGLISISYDVSTPTAMHSCDCMYKLICLH